MAKITIYCEAPSDVCKDCPNGYRCDTKKEKEACICENFIETHMPNGALIGARCTDCNARYDAEEYMIHIRKMEDYEARHRCENNPDFPVDRKQEADYDSEG